MENKLAKLMGAERFIRDRIFTGHKHNHDGKRANMLRLDSANASLSDYRAGEGTEIVLFPQAGLAGDPVASEVKPSGDQ